ncbi:hypothetical protein B0O99DRAFT_610838 [Bisporella sp. PMI_857]|nr:hypothetical protein B0O99DRAFT_612369 [Bisporella sp. PMI_857]KAH8600505.1 hypothetical protein B0O99DRAFT_610838 [Bisporella sp. PMI_857]
MAGNVTIATGFWQNHSYEGWKASTLTLSVRDGAILISGLATFIAIVGGRFWSIVAFAIHQIKSSRIPKDGLYHQHQIVYRNNSSAVGASWQIFRIAYSWGSNARLNWLRMAVSAVPPLVCFLGFTAASVLSAKVAAPSYTASQVRIQEAECGYWSWTQPSDPDQLKLESMARSIWGVKKSITAKNYARSCYGDSAQNSLSCGTFVVSSLPYTTRDNATCPFESSRCLLGLDTAYEMKTDWLDSHLHFGINSVPESRIKYRKVVTCSVLNITDRIITTDLGSHTEYYYNLGQSYIGQATYHSSDAVPNGNVGYSLWAFRYLLGVDAKSWTPIPDLNKTDADASLFFLGGNTHRILDNPYTNSTFYNSDSLNTAMACTEQYQILNPDTNILTSLGSWLNVANEIQSLGLNTKQLAIAKLLMTSASWSTMFDSVEGLGASSLKSQESVVLLLAPAVPTNQWQIEAAGWFDTALSGLQAMMLSFASKNSSGIAPWGSIQLPINNTEAEAAKAMCKQQIVRNIGAYQSFSVLGIAIILSVGLLIILVSLVLDIVVGAFQKHGWGENFKRVAWNLDSMLHQQRMAFEGQGMGGVWSNCDDTVPITARENV